MSASSSVPATPPSTPPESGRIRIRGARQHNLKNVDIDIPLGTLTVFTGPSGSGKSSLVFDTLFAEGQRRYVETFSAYARQFLDRMDKPAVDKVDGVPPAIAIDQINPVRSSRSTVGTMTELNDHLKLLFARQARLFDKLTGEPVQKADLASIRADLQQRLANLPQARIVITFALPVPANTPAEQMQEWLSASGFSKIHASQQTATGTVLLVVADRFRWDGHEPQRLTEALEAALRHGAGRLRVHLLPEQEGQAEQNWLYSTTLYSAASDTRYLEPTPSLFSFNSAHGACPHCKGFGRVIGVDLDLVIPDRSLTLRAGAVKPMQTPAWKEAQDDLMRHAEAEGIPRDTPFAQLTPAQQDWVIHGSPLWKGSWNKQWFGVMRFFAYLESKAYKMHIRVLLSKYRSYTLCPVCAGARLQLEGLLWRLGSKALADSVLPPAQRFLPQGVGYTRAVLETLPGLNLHDLMQLPLSKLRTWTEGLVAEMKQVEGQDHTADAKALAVLLREITARLNYLAQVGLGYLTLDRQSRTLSGGEVQRINLTTSLGTSLVNTLFVLDEPSIGLHHRDLQRINHTMLRLRDAGNTLVVVEHDPAVMRIADRLVDMGPGPGSAGGQIVFDGTPAQAAQADTVTGQYLGGRKHIGQGLKRLVQPHTPKLLLQGVRANNLKNINVEIPLERMVCITGVSGSGKSTLVQDVLAPALLRHFGKPSNTPGAHDSLLGAEQLAQVVFMDQSPIGKTARSNPASFVGVWDAVRELFAQAPLAKERGYTRATFSFNTGDGRCPTCGGSGFEHVEMQFLSDVYLRCEDCNGQRYRAEVLQVQIERQNRALNVADVLALTVADAAVVFADDPSVVALLRPLQEVGLAYVQLGQPVPTLSGGEAQRLKIAAELAQAAQAMSASKQKLARKGTLFILDEPTTGLHFDDIAKLLRALRKLLDAGHSILLVEHNLEVIAASDWLIDLGPEAGEEGGQIVAQGSPEDVARSQSGHTAAALRELQQQMQAKLQGAVQTHAHAQVQEPAAGYRVVRSQAPAHIAVRNATEHNLRGLDVDIPRGKLNVITGVSGSGKSTLAFDIVFSEGQRRYLESLNAYARSIVQPPARPDVDAVYGIPPTVAIEQRLSRGGQKSTVATITEIWHFLRLLYVKLGVQHCVHDGTPVQAQSAEQIFAHVLRTYQGQHIGLLAPLVVGRKGIYTELADWANKLGYSHLRVDGVFVPTQGFPKLDRFKEHHIELPIADLVISVANEAQLLQAIAKALQMGKGVLHVLQDMDGLASSMQAGAGGAGIGRVEVFSTTRVCPVCSTSYAEPDPRLFSYNSKHGWCVQCVGTGLELRKEQKAAFDGSAQKDDGGREQSFVQEEPEDLSGQPCTHCHGTRLNATARAVRFAGKAITDLAALSVADLAAWLPTVALDARSSAMMRDVLPEIAARLAFLQQVGLGYLSLDRAAPSLSGGEAQRIRLAAQLGSNLQGVCYVLDEPTIGLHPRDNQLLINTLRDLTDKGNTLMVVEHDEEMIRHADHLIDIGPGAGKRGGQLVAQGSLEDLTANAQSTTGKYLRHAARYTLAPHSALAEHVQWLTVQAPTLHNLKGMDVALPLQKLVLITGVSGSGKSTLARDVLYANLHTLLAQTGKNRGKDVSWVGCAGISGTEAIDRILEVDQTPIGKTPRSCPATYMGIWDAIRKLFAETLEAKARGYTAARFSFNTGDGRCKACEGQGMRSVAMSFLPDVKVQCEVCGGARFNPETLGVQWRGKSIGDVLHMPVDEAVAFFANMPQIAHPLQLLQDVGLGYLELGQASPTLSGGEAQRLKLVTELAKVRDDVGRRGQKSPRTLYVLDEPTVGLHMGDIQKIIAVLQRLVAAGHSVLVVEHDLDVIAKADWIVDMGPEGGTAGGQVVVAGTPRQVAACVHSHTGQALAAHAAKA